MTLDDVNCGLFQVKTKAAKDILVNRSEELKFEILKKINEICTENIKAIGKSYEDRKHRLVPTETASMMEDELRELKKLVSENDTAMQKLKN